MRTKNRSHFATTNFGKAIIVALFWAFGGLIAVSLSSCRESPQIGSSGVSNSNDIPQNGPYEITLAKDTCIKFGREVPEKYCAPQAKKDQCWLGSGSLLTVRVLYQATEIGRNRDKYLSFQVADGVTNTLASQIQSNSDISDTVPCATNLINNRMKQDKSVSFIWSDHISKIKDKTGNEISLNAVATPPARTLTSIFQLSRHGILTSGFGPRWGRQHRGIDIAWLPGTPIYAYCSGEVQFAGANDEYFGYGNIVVLKHNENECNGVTYTRYAHNNSLSVRTGDPVLAGQEIAKMGSTGRSTGPHLHFETRDRNQVAFNPLRVLSDGRSSRHPVMQMFQNIWIEKLGPQWEQVSFRSSEDLNATRDVLGRVLGFRFEDGQLPAEIATIQSDEEGSSFALAGSSRAQTSDYLTPSIAAFGNRPAVLVKDGDASIALEIDLEGGELSEQ